MCSSWRSFGAKFKVYPMYGKSIRSAMKLSSLVITPRGGLRLVAVLALCCSILVHISAMDENMEGRRRGEDQNINRMSADGGETGEKQSLLNRERRAVKKNATPSPLPDFEKRLKAVEERFVMLL